MLYFFTVLLFLLLFIEPVVLALPLSVSRHADAADHNANVLERTSSTTSNLLFRRSPASGWNYPQQDRSRSGQPPRPPLVLDTNSQGGGPGSGQRYPQAHLSSGPNPPQHGPGSAHPNYLPQHGSGSAPGWDQNLYLQQHVPGSAPGWDQNSNYPLQQPHPPARPASSLGQNPSYPPQRGSGSGQPRLPTRPASSLGQNPSYPPQQQSGSASSRFRNDPISPTYPSPERVTPSNDLAHWNVPRPASSSGPPSRNQAPHIQTTVQPGDPSSPYGMSRYSQFSGPPPLADTHTTPAFPPHFHRQKSIPPGLPQNVSPGRQGRHPPYRTSEHLLPPANSQQVPAPPEFTHSTSGRHNPPQVSGYPHSEYQQPRTSRDEPQGTFASKPTDKKYDATTRRSHPQEIYIPPYEGVPVSGSTTSRRLQNPQAPGSHTSEHGGATHSGSGQSQDAPQKGSQNAAEEPYTLARKNEIMPCKGRLDLRQKACARCRNSKRKCETHFEDGNYACDLCTSRKLVCDVWSTPS